MDRPPTTTSVRRPLTGLVACATVAVLTGPHLAQDGVWFFAFAPAALLGFLCLAKLLAAFGVPVAPIRRGHPDDSNDFEPKPHPNAGLINPATRLFITRAGVDMSGNGYDMGSKGNR